MCFGMINNVWDGNYKTPGWWASPLPATPSWCPHICIYLIYDPLRELCCRIAIISTRNPIRSLFSYCVIKQAHRPSLMEQREIAPCVQTNFLVTACLEFKTFNQLYNFPNSNTDRHPQSEQMHNLLWIVFIMYLWKKPARSSNIKQVSP